MTDKESCENCKYWEDLSPWKVGQGMFTERDGNCLRNAPTIYNDGTMGKFPTIQSDKWCGEWEGKENDNKTE